MSASGRILVLASEAGRVGGTYPVGRGSGSHSLVLVASTLRVSLAAGCTLAVLPLIVTTGCCTVWLAALGLEMSRFTEQAPRLRRCRLELPIQAQLAVISTLVQLEATCRARLTDSQRAKDKWTTLMCVVSTSSCTYEKKWKLHGNKWRCQCLPLGGTHEW